MDFKKKWLPNIIQIYPIVKTVKPLMRTALCITENGLQITAVEPLVLWKCLLDFNEKFYRLLCSFQTIWLIQVRERSNRSSRFFSNQKILTKNIVAEDIEINVISVNFVCLTSKCNSRVSTCAIKDIVCLCNKRSLPKPKNKSKKTQPANVGRKAL